MFLIRFLLRCLAIVVNLLANVEMLLFRAVIFVVLIAVNIDDFLAFLTRLLPSDLMFM